MLSTMKDINRRTLPSRAQIDLKQLSPEQLDEWIRTKESLDSLEQELELLNHTLPACLRAAKADSADGLWSALSDLLENDQGLRTPPSSPPDKAAVENKFTPLWTSSGKPWNDIAPLVDVVWAELEQNVKSKVLAATESNRALLGRRTSTGSLTDEATVHLSERDMPIFAQSPLTDPLDLVVCSSCSTVVLVSAFASHWEKCHRKLASPLILDLRKLANHASSTPAPPARVKRSADAALPRAPSLQQTDDKKCLQAPLAAKEATPLVPSPSSSPKAAHLLPIKAESSISDPPEEPVVVDKPLAVEDASLTKSLSDAPVAVATPQSAGESVRPKKKTKLELRGYDVDVICGVRSKVTKPDGSEAEHICRRSVTCKLHTMAAKRQVPGRSRPLSELIATSLAAFRSNKMAQQGASSDSTIPNEQLISNPTPLAVCTFGARRIGPYEFAFGRSNDYMRALTSAFVIAELMRGQEVPVNGKAAGTSVKRPAVINGAGKPTGQPGPTVKKKPKLNSKLSNTPSTTATIPNSISTDNVMPQTQPDNPTQSFRL